MFFKLKLLCMTSLIIISKVESRFMTINWNSSTDLGNSDHERDYRYPMYQEVAPVPCDLTTSCDPFCCEDPDCNEYEIAHCTRTNNNCSGFLSLFDCNCINFNTPEWLSVFCYVYKNPVYLGKFFKTPQKIEKLGTLRNIINKNKFFLFNQNKIERTAKSANLFGSPIMTFVPMSTSFPSVVPLSTKTSLKDSTYACTSSPVKYRLNGTNTCLAKITREICQNGHELGVFSYLVKSDNSSTFSKVPAVLKDSNFLEGLETEIMFTCVELKLKTVLFKKQDMNFFQGTNIKRCSQSPSAYRTVLSNETCMNVLVYVRYQFIVNESEVIRLKVEYGLTNISLPVETNKNENHKYIYLKQSFSACFSDIMHKSYNNKSQSRNDDIFNRGYFIEEELNIGYKLNNDSSAHWKKGVLGVFGKGGSCDSLSPITFGFDVFSICRIRRRFTNCTQLRNTAEEAFEALLQGDSLAAYANLRAPFNNTVPLLRNYHNASGEILDQSIQCSVPTTQKVLIQYTSIPTESGRLIHRIIGARVNRELQNVSVTEPEFQLSAQALFFYVSSSERKPMSRFWQKMFSRELSENSWFNIFNAFENVDSVEREEITFWCTAMMLSVVALVFLSAKVDIHLDPLLHKSQGVTIFKNSELPLAEPNLFPLEEETVLGSTRSRRKWAFSAGKYMGCVNSSMISNAHDNQVICTSGNLSTRTRILQEDIVDRYVNRSASQELTSECIPTGEFIDGMLGLCDNEIIIEKLSNLNHGELFEDEEFPADSSSLSFSNPQDDFFKGVVWKRPHSISATPYLFVDGTSRSDVKQGILGNCWFLSACASVAKRQDLIERVIDPSQHLFGEGYRGVLLINFWRFGEWVTVHIDDRLPTKNGLLIYGSCTDENEFWLALVEKAYAKLHGTYEALAGGHALEAFVDLTGGIAERIRISPAFITCSKKSDEGHHQLDCRKHAHKSNGLVEGHAYTVTSVATVDLLSGDIVELVRVRNPWGDAVEWEGPWSDRSTKWNEVSEADKRRLRVLPLEDGEFWMDFEDFQQQFEEVTVATIGPDFNQDGLPDTPLEIITIKSSWKKGVNAGGCRNDLEKFSLNPQYQLHLQESDLIGDDEQCSVLVGLMQEHRRSEKNRRLAMLPIAFFIYKTETIYERLGAEYFLCVPEESSSGDFIDCREVILRVDLQPGYYVIIPATFHPDCETNFMLRVFALRPFSLEEIPNDENYLMGCERSDEDEKESMASTINV